MLALPHTREFLPRKDFYCVRWKCGDDFGSTEDKCLRNRTGVVFVAMCIPTRAFVASERYTMLAVPPPHAFVPRKEVSYRVQ